MNTHLKRGNILWEGRRMFLPEHREQVLGRRRLQRVGPMPDLNQDHFAIIARVITESLASKEEITLTVYDSIENRRLIGYVVRLDLQVGRLLVQRTDGDEWVEWGNIVNAEIVVRSDCYAHEIHRPYSRDHLSRPCR